jgi:hypothetical protein
VHEPAAAQQRVVVEEKAAMEGGEICGEDREEEKDRDGE